MCERLFFFFFFQAEDGIRDRNVTGVQTCALPISSHFFGMDGYAQPGDAPEHFISTSLQRFEKITHDSGVVVRPWLQAFAWRTKTYSPQYIETQVRVARENGGIGFLFWNARNDYGRPFAAMPQMRADAAHYFQAQSARKPVQAAASSGPGR